MNHTQKHVLYTIVQEAKGQAMRLPTAKRLAQLLHHSKEPTTGQVRAANAHILRLNQKYGCFSKGKRHWQINRDALVTESEEALYLVTLSEVCHTDPERRVRKERLHKLLQHNHGVALPALDRILSRVTRAEYVEEIPAAPGYLRIGRRTSDQLPFLRRLAKGFSRGK